MLMRTVSNNFASGSGRRCSQCWIVGSAKVGMLGSCERVQLFVSEADAVHGWNDAGELGAGHPFAALVILYG
jgi:hypothetical protein